MLKMIFSECNLKGRKLNNVCLLVNELNRLKANQVVFTSFNGNDYLIGYDSDNNIIKIENKNNNIIKYLRKEIRNIKKGK